MPELEIRRATGNDIPLLVDAICEAEKGGTDILSYCHIFGYTETEFRALLRSMLEEDLEGQELAISSFLVACDGEVPIGAVAAWVEGGAGASSTILKANLLLHFVDRDRMRSAQQYFAKLAAITIPRSDGAIQIESVYVHSSRRGQGVAVGLINRHIELLASLAPAKKAEVILTANNLAARAAYQRAGFFPVVERHSDDESLLALVPSLGKLMMQRPLKGE